MVSSDLPACEQTSKGAHTKAAEKSLALELHKHPSQRPQDYIGMCGTVWLPQVRAANLQHQDWMPLLLSMPAMLRKHGVT